MKKQKNVCPKCKQSFGYTFNCEEKDKDGRIYSHQICTHCGYRDNIRWRVYFGLGEKDGKIVSL